MKIDERMMKRGLYNLAGSIHMIANSIQVELEEEDSIPKEVIDNIARKAIEEVEEEEREEEEIQETLVEEGTVVELSRESLEKLGYRDLQKVAKDLDILATGKAEDLLDRILGEKPEEVIETIEELAEEEVIEVDALEELVEEIEEEEVEEEVDSRADKIDEVLEDYTVEDLADVLESVGISPKGKRQALLAKILKAVDEGLLEIELDSEEEEVEEEEEFEEAMTEARRATSLEVIKQIDELIEGGKISEKEIDEVLVTVYTIEDGYTDKLPLDEKIEMYKEVYVNLVDDEGEQHSLEEPYSKDGEYACCSKDLVEIENGNLQCQVCSTEYEIG